jgi:RimJ/RimL family protein N-acetyltransferase
MLTSIPAQQPRIHTMPFIDSIKAHPDLVKYLVWPAIETEADFMTKFYDKIDESIEDCLYAIIDKTRPPSKENDVSNYAGVASLMATNPVNAVTEAGIILFPEFQRTHVATNAIGLLLLWTLDPPSAGGLGLRRVEWQTHSENAPSRRIALRMGFELEGIARWQRVFPGGKVALPVDALEKRNGTTGETPGRHTAIFSIVWDEWDDKRAKVIALMERKR